MQMLIAIEYRLMRRSHGNSRSPAGPRFFLHAIVSPFMQLKELVNSHPETSDARASGEYAQTSILALHVGIRQLRIKPERGKQAILDGTDLDQCYGKVRY